MTGGMAEIQDIQPYWGENGEEFLGQDFTQFSNVQFEYQRRSAKTVEGEAKK